MWVRGLKLTKCGICAERLESHPMWVRGLKRINALTLHHPQRVAPYVGAWIETYWCFLRHWFWSVAPYVGAWIETHVLL